MSPPVPQLYLSTGLGLSLVAEPLQMFGLDEPRG